MAPGRRLHVLVVGAGVAGLETALALRHLAGDRVRVDLLAPRAELYYWPLLVTEPFGAGGGETIELEPLLAQFAIRFRRGCPRLRRRDDEDGRARRP